MGVYGSFREDSYETAAHGVMAQSVTRDKWAIPSYRAFVRRRLRGGGHVEDFMPLEEVVKLHDEHASPREERLAPEIEKLRRARQVFQ
jgi:hypothetical protein